MNEINIRRATIGDLKIIQELNHKLCLKENHEYDSTINPDYPFSKSGEDYFRSRIESTDALALIAEENGNIVGYLVGALIATEDYRIPIKIAEAENAYVDEVFRSRGIGGRLAQEFEEWCRNNGAQRIRYVASAANAKAIKFYKAHGAEEISLTLEKEI